MYHHRRVTCPKCDLIAERTIGTELFGSPYRVCKHCKGVYFDPEYQEKAMAVFNDKGWTFDIWLIPAFLVFNGLLLYFIIGSVRAESLPRTTYGMIAFFTVLILSTLIDIGVIRIVLINIHAEEYHKKQIDKLEAGPVEWDDDLAESMKRMSDRGYLDVLRARGVAVPEYFYKRVGSRPGSFVEPEGVVEVKNAIRWEAEF